MKSRKFILTTPTVSKISNVIVSPSTHRVHVYTFSEKRGMAIVEISIDKRRVYAMLFWQIATK